MKIMANINNFWKEIKEGVSGGYAKLHVQRSSKKIFLKTFPKMYLYVNLSMQMSLDRQQDIGLSSDIAIIYKCTATVATRKHLKPKEM